MTLSTSHLAYTAEIDHLEAALASSRGIRLQFPNYAAASTYRHRLHHARTLDRKRNLEVYEKGTDLYGTSVYDELVCRLKSRGAFWYIYIERGRPVAQPEEIPEDDPEPEALERRAEPMLPAPPLLLPGFKRRI